MGCGTLIYSNGLKGTDPVHISNGGNIVTFVGNSNTPYIKNISIVGTGGRYDEETATVTFTLTEYPKYCIVDGTGWGFVGTGGSTFTSTLTANGYAMDFAGMAGGGTDQGTVPHQFLCKIDTGGTKNVISEYPHGTLPFSYFVKDYVIYDYNTASTLTARHHTSTLADPTTGFASYGSEFDSTEYNNTKSADDADYASHDYVVYKVICANPLKYIMPTYLVKVTESDQTCTPNIWNFNTSAWEGLYNVVSQTSAYAGAVQGHPFGKVLAYTNYKGPSGEFYIQIDNSNQIGYIGLFSFNAVQDF